MPLKIVTPGVQPTDQFDALMADPTIRQYQCPECGVVVEGTNKDVYDSMTVFGKPVHPTAAIQRFENATITFSCPGCGKTQEFIRLDAVEADEIVHGKPDDLPGKGNP